MSKKTYIREIKTVSTDRYMEVDLFRITERQHKAKRAGKSRPSSPVQDNLNQRRAARKRLQLMNANFCEGESFHLSLTYSPEMLPQNDEQAKADRVNCLRRVARECRRRGMPPPKVMGVTAGAPGKPRYHHHMKRIFDEQFDADPKQTIHRQQSDLYDLADSTLYHIEKERERLGMEALNS